MATISALKNLGSSIVSDITGAASSVKAAYNRHRTEKQVVKDFRDLLREDPMTVLKAFHSIKEQDAPKPRKPRAKKAATE